MHQETTPAPTHIQPEQIHEIVLTGVPMAPSGTAIEGDQQPPHSEASRQLKQPVGPDDPRFKTPANQGDLANFARDLAVGSAEVQQEIDAGHKKPV